MSTKELLAEAVRDGARRRGFSVREMARESGLSLAQVNRLRAAQVDRPSSDTVLAIAKALGRNPNLLFVVAGSVSDDEAREVLAQTFATGNELIKVWKWLGRNVEETRRQIADPLTPSEAIRRLALDVFLGPEAEENLWKDVYVAAGAEGESGRELRELVRMWAYLSRERRKKVVEYVRDQHALARREDLDEMRKEEPDYGKP